MPASADQAHYLDSSAIVKLVVREPETTALAAYLSGGGAVISSELALVEVLRAVRDRGREAHARAVALLDRVELLSLDVPLLRAAAALDSPVLRSLDAIHLASAGSLAEDLAEIVTYDVRMADAARALRMPVAAPS